jgi:Spy/CpxP family protein refolding chaperone
MNTRTLPLLVLSLSMSLFACARSEKAPPLPGDSVSNDGAVSLASPRLSTGAAAAPATREALSAIEQRLFPAEIVIEHKIEIALTQPQEDAITKELDRSQSQLVKLQWALQTEKGKLVKVLDDAKVDETKAHQTAELLMQRENAIKAVHLDLLVRIKNILTSEQQEKLRAAREADRCGAAKDAAKDAGRD